MAHDLTPRFNVERQEKWHGVDNTELVNATQELIQAHRTVSAQAVETMRGLDRGYSLTLDAAKERARKWHKIIMRYAHLYPQRTVKELGYAVVRYIPEIHLDSGYHVVSMDSFLYTYAVKRNAVVWCVVPGKID